MNKKRSLDKALQALENQELGIDKDAGRLGGKVAAEALPLLKTIDKIKDLSGDTPGPDNKQSNKADFLALVAQEGRLGQAGKAPWLFTLGSRMRSGLGRAAIAATAVVLMSGGVAAAAGSAGPTDTLYPVKKMIEAARQALPKNANTSAALHLSLAAARWGEIRNLKDRELGKTLASELRFHLDESRKAAKRLPAQERKTILSKLKTIEDRIDRRYPRGAKPVTSRRGGDDPVGEVDEDGKVEDRLENVRTPDGEDSGIESDGPASLDRPAGSEEPPETETEIDQTSDEPIESPEAGASDD